MKQVFGIAVFWENIFKKVNILHFSVIDSGKNDFEVTIKEAFHIKFSKPIMNKQLFIQGSSFVLNVF